MKKKHRGIFLFLTAFLLCLAFSGPAPAADVGAEEATAAGASEDTIRKTASRKKGFQVINGKTYYYKNGKKLKSTWLTIKKKKKTRTYYFNRKGIMLTGKVVTKKKVYYFHEDGVFDHAISKRKKMVALTFDDGPSIYTPMIVRALKAAGGRATFFVVGERVSSYSKQMKAAYDIGCEIGNHSWDHSQLTSLGSYQVERQIIRTSEAIAKVTGEEPVVTRPPYGSVNARVADVIGMPLILWNIDTEDWRTRNSYSTIQCIKDEVRDGSIILMHDLYQASANAAVSIIPWLKDQGYQLVTISEMADCRGGMTSGEKYYSFKK